MTSQVCSIEELETRRKRLIYRSWHRGTREMDLILGAFADSHVSGFSEQDLTAYEALLEQNDPDLYDWITGKEPPPAEVRSSVFERLKELIVTQNKTPTSS